MSAKRARRTSAMGAGGLLVLAILIAAFLTLGACGDAGSTEKAKDDLAAARAALSTDTDTAGDGSATAAAGKGKPAKPLVVGFGQRVDVNEYIAAGSYTVVDFYSDYCGPCRQFAPWLEKLHKARGDVVVVKVDINRDGVRGIDWGSPVAKQYGLRSIPHIKVYDTNGNLAAEGQAATQMVVKWLEELG